VEVKPTLVKTVPPSLSNRVVIRKDAGMVMIGHKRETAQPLALAGRNLDFVPDLRNEDARAIVPGTT
jgi:hypothetical protein